MKATAVAPQSAIEIVLIGVLLLLMEQGRTMCSQFSSPANALAEITNESSIGLGERLCPGTLRFLQEQAPIQRGQEPD